MLLNRVQRLNNFGVTNICIACNTAHILYDYLQKSSAIPITSLICLVSDQVKRQNCHRVGVLATPMTIKHDLYHQHLGNHNLIYPKLDDQIIHEQIIGEGISGKITTKHQTYFQHYATSFIHQDKLDGLILGCTELSLFFPHRSQKIIDSLEVLATHLVTDYYSGG